MYNNYGNKINKESNMFNIVIIHKKELVIINNDIYQSTVGLRITIQTRNIISPFYNSHLLSQIIGYLLSNGSLALAWSSQNPYFILTQEFIRFKYV